MRRFALALLALPALAAPAFAQSYTGSWGCRNDMAEKAGILTIYGNVYGFASTTFGDEASGTGTITGYTDGVGFNDGPLRAVRGIEAGRMVSDPASGVAIQLETADSIVMLCTAI
jgi:hypothetical protein